MILDDKFLFIRKYQNVKVLSIGNIAPASNEMKSVIDGILQNHLQMYIFSQIIRVCLSNALEDVD